MDRGKRFAITIWDEWLPEFDPQVFSYGIFGWEQAPSTGKWHWQGYVETWTKRNHTRLAKLLDCETPPHVEVARGSAAENKEYCIKNNDTFEFGSPMRQGERVDLKQYVDKIMCGELSMEDLIIEHPMVYHQFGRTLTAADSIRLKRLKHPAEGRVVEWIYGPAGIGKSRYANLKAPNAYVWRPSEKYQEYNGEPDFIIEEFRATTLSVANFLLLTDNNYSNFFVERKYGGFIPVVASRIFITSNFSPEEIFNTGEHPQILRRLTIIEMK